jgi:hypothetical protein
MMRETETLVTIFTSLGCDQKAAKDTILDVAGRSSPRVSLDVVSRARGRTQGYVTHGEASDQRGARYVNGRSRKLVRHAG